MAEPLIDGSPSTPSRGRKVAPLDLSRLVLGYYRDDPDHLGHFEIGQTSATECLQSLGVRVALEHHGCLPAFCDDRTRLYIFEEDSRIQDGRPGTALCMRSRRGSSV